MNGKSLMKKTPSSLDDYIASQGRRGDTLVAHMSPREAMLLKKMGGSGGINPKTGMIEFWDADSDATADAASESGTEAGEGHDNAGSFGGGDTSMGGYDTNFGGGYGPGVTAADVSGTRGDPTGTYGMVANVKDLDPIGDFLSKYGRAGAIGFNMAGPKGAVVAMLGKGVYEGAKEMYGMTPEERAAAFAQMEKATQSAMPDTGEGGSGLTAPLAVSPSPVALTEEEKRRRIIEENRIGFNQQMVGLSNRDVPYTRR